MCTVLLIPHPTRTTRGVLALFAYFRQSIISSIAPRRALVHPMDSHSRTCRAVVLPSRQRLVTKRCQVSCKWTPRARRRPRCPNRTLSRRPKAYGRRARRTKTCLARHSCWTSTLSSSCLTISLPAWTTQTHSYVSIPLVSLCVDADACPSDSLCKVACMTSYRTSSL